MTVACVVLIIITLITPILILAAAPFIKIVTNNYFFWMGLGILILAYSISLRFYASWEEFSKGIDLDINKSRAFFLDLCPFTIFALGVSIIADPTRKIASVLGSFAIIGGFVTLVGGYAFNQDEPSLDWHYIFIGDGPNPIYFMMHYMNIVVGTLLLVSTPKLGFQRFIYSNAFAILYFSYVGIVMTALHVTDHVTGLSPNDWAPGGEYYAVDDIFHAGYPGCMIIGYMIAYISVTLVIFLMDLLQKNKYYRWYNIRNQLWYIGWYKLTLDTNELKQLKLQEEKKFNIVETLKFWKYRI